MTTTTTQAESVMILIKNLRKRVADLEAEVVPGRRRSDTPLRYNSLRGDEDASGGPMLSIKRALGTEVNTPALDDGEELRQQEEYEYVVSDLRDGIANSPIKFAQSTWVERRTLRE